MLVSFLPLQEGYLVEHDGKCITVFSAPNYCDQVRDCLALPRTKEDAHRRPFIEAFATRVNEYNAQYWLVVVDI